MSYRYLAIIFFLITSQAADGQTLRIEKLRKKVYSITQEKEKLVAILALCEEYQSLNRDTLDYYSYLALEMAQKNGDPTMISMADIAVGQDLYRWGWIDSLQRTVEPALRINPVKNAETRKIYFQLARLKAFSYGGRSQFKEALNIFYSIVRDAEKYRDTVVLGLNANSIGSIALARNQSREAFRWIRKALSYAASGSAYESVKTASFINLANAYLSLGKTDSAAYYVSNAILLSRKQENLTHLSTALRVQSQILTNEKKFSEAENVLLEMLKIRKLMGDQENHYTDEVMQLLNLYMETGQYDKTIAYCTNLLEPKGATGSHETISSPNLRLEYYEVLAKCYKITGRNVLYQQTLEKLVAAKDSFYNDNSAEALAEMQVKYESEKQQNQIKDLENDRFRREAERQSLIRNFLIGLVLGGLAITAYVIYTNSRLKLKNESLIRKNREIEEAHVKGQNVERKRVASELHDNLNTKLAALRWRLEALNIENYPESDRNILAGLIEMLEDVYADVRLISHNMLPAELETQGLASALQKLTEKLNINPRTVFTLVLDGIQKRLDPKVEFELYNIALELVNNIIKHAQASQVWISLSQVEKDTTLTVSDNGIGFDTDNESIGIGLRNISSRVDALHGNWRVESSPELGSKVIVEVSK